MSTNHYPWQVEPLTAWLRLEMGNHASLRALADEMQIPPSSLRAWLSEPSPPITLKEIRSIAQYRCWSMQQTLDWLNIKPAHLEDMLAQDNSDGWTTKGAAKTRFNSPEIPPNPR